MGAKFFKDYNSTPNQGSNSSTIPMEREHIELLSQTDLTGELNKLYLNSREKLHAITENHTEEMLNNIAHYMKLNSKFLSECFNEAQAHRYDIVDMVTDRLTFQDVDDNTSTSSNTDSKNMDSFFSSNRNYFYEKP